MMQNDLIFDIGLHRGLDTEWYLAKGFRVVAVEANPRLADEVSTRLAGAVAAGKLIVENVGIAPSPGTLPFFVNHDNDEWSSFDEKLGTRESSSFEVMPIPCINARTLFERHGLPYFVKIDIEGFDHHVVRALGQLSEKPRYVSVEDNGFESFLELFAIGCRSFKFLDQVEKWNIKLPNPPLEGVFAEGKFGAGTSGPFGDEVPGEWLRTDSAALYYLTQVRPPGVGLREHWWDIHAKFS
jgi:FkbM family methyltransferase